MMVKMLKKKLFLLLVLVFVAVNVVHYTSDEVYAAFKDSGWGARSAGMGGAFCAIADDTSAPLWNPAGITQVRRPEANFMYAKLFAGLETVSLGLDYFSFVFPRNRYTGAWGISWANFSCTDLYREDTISITYAERLNDFFPRLIPEVSLGLSVKYLNHGYTLDEYAKLDTDVFGEGTSKYAFTGDAGLLVKSNPGREPWISIGASVKNIIEPDVGLRTKDIVPMETKFGVAYRMGDFKLFNALVMEDVTGAFDVTLRDKDWNYHLGWESWFKRRTFGLRAGGNNREITIGLSYDNEILKSLGIQFDYAFILPLQIEETWGSHRISLTVRFGSLGKF